MANQYNMRNRNGLEENELHENNGTMVNEIIANGSINSAATTVIINKSIRYDWRHVNRNYNTSEQIGNTRPVVLDNQGSGQGHVASPTDSLELGNGINFSTKVEEYFPYPRESQAEQDTTPHLLPAIADGIDRMNVTENDPESNPADPTLDDGICVRPAESQHDTDYSINSDEHQHRTNVNTTAIDEQRLAPEVTDIHRENETGATSNTMEVISNVTRTNADARNISNIHADENQPTTDTNNTANDQKSTVQQGTDESARLLPTETAVAITEVKHDVPIFSRTVSTEETTADQ